MFFFKFSHRCFLQLWSTLALAAVFGQLTALCLIDLTAAFDTVDDLLLLRLERQFGLQGVALQWFRSYLSGRSFRVLYCNQSSTAVYIVRSAVPQGSVLGPRLIIFYMADLADEVKQRQVNMHAHADDTELYLHCCLDDTAAAVTRLEICLDDVSHWMAANRLKQVERREDRITLGWV